MRRFTTLRAAAAAAALTLTLTGCGGADEPETVETTPAAAETTTVETSEPVETTETTEPVEDFDDTALVSALEEWESLYAMDTNEWWPSVTDREFTEDGELWIHTDLDGSGATDEDLAQRICGSYSTYAVSDPGLEDVAGVVSVRSSGETELERCGLNS